jgi:short subunit dehydrogenase-like uncharacterized protein
VAIMLDVVLYGATGFTGKQTAHYFARHAPSGLRWAIAGRNPAKLDELARETNPSEVIVADSGDPAAVDAMVARGRVVATTAGPYAKYGTPVVEACVHRGVDYLDITGEVPWVRGLIDRFHREAAARGTRIVPFSGFDSVPSDLGTLMTVDHIRRELGQDTRLVSNSFALRGGLNGGTLDTALVLAQPDARRLGADVLLLNPPERQTDDERARSADLRGVEWDEAKQVWLVPFVMAAINTRVVRRSNALFATYDRPYGPEFTYQEAHETRRRSNAYAIALGAAGFAALAKRSWGRGALRRLGPSPGEGPSEKTMDRGFFRCRLLGEAADGRRVMTTLSADGDPGNRVTVAILCEAALLLATERERLPGGAERGGILTPATGLGLPLLDRLRAVGFQAATEPAG